MRSLGLLALLALAAACGDRSVNASAVHTGAAADVPPPIARVDRLEPRRVWSGADPNFYAGAPSPDGRLVTEIDWGTGDLAVRDLETGEMRRVTDKGPWSKSGDFAEHSVFSPDGERIAYTWFNDQIRRYEVRTIRLDGSDMRILVSKAPELTYACVEDWSRDGSSILVTTFLADRSSQIATVSAADGSLRVLKTSDWRHPLVSAFSPDGRHVAYDYPKAQPQIGREIRVLTIGGRETVAATGPGTARLLGWLPDGSGILYHASTNQTRAIWALRVSDGGSAGQPQLVRPDVWQVQPLGFTKNSFVYGVSVEGRRIRVGPVDLVNGQPLAEATPVSDPTHARSHDPVWSRDGKLLAYLAQSGGTGQQLEITNGAGEVQRQIPMPVSFNPRKLVWTPDNAGILVFGSDPQGRHGIHRIDLRQATLTPVLVEGHVNDGMTFYALSPDGATLYYRKAVELAAVSKPHAIVARDLRTGSEKDVLRVGPGRGIVVSPDGKWLAYTDENMPEKKYNLMIAPVGGGTPRSVYQPFGRVMNNRWGLNWAPDGRSLVVYDEPANRPAGVWQVPIDGRPPRLVMDMRRISGGAADPAAGLSNDVRPIDLRLSPDGRRLAYEFGRDRGEIWMISGFPSSSR
ncbi:MAG: hypothetical protein A3H96_20965 [Acidobacteria bacterium RIFCSPLOWO2_02_FULL_67_36]|nr:MAG: hypothetical protein A3H96_20965 [Acidobacteria bacterium RIFCSPLOWO2_02_FULL_67_36]OFW21904.1 MAG: hypothetical protein A3G21_08530 [Acidobacteria bacterium RIFCSPLOWO2_12_FULL_66_21]